MDTTTVLRFTSAHADAALIAGVFSLLSLVLGFFVMRHQLNKQLGNAKKLAEYEHRLTRELDTHRRAIDFKFEEVRNAWEVSKPLQLVVRTHLADTRTLLTRVRVSFSRLATLAPTLKGEDTLTEVTNTLGLYAEYRHHLAATAYASYPVLLTETLSSLQATLSGIFLELHFEESEKHKTTSPRMTACLKDLDEKVALASQQIEELIRVRIVPLGGDA